MEQVASTRIWINNKMTEVSSVSTEKEMMSENDIARDGWVLRMGEIVRCHKHQFYTG